VSGETGEVQSGWTVDTVRAELSRAIASQREYFDRVVQEHELRWKTERDDDKRATITRFENYRQQREDDRRMADITAKLTADATMFHLDSRRQWQEAHLSLHGKEKETLDALARTLAAQRIEDENIVANALRAVQEAAQIHAVAHEQQHHSHQEIHSVEKEAVDKASTQMDKRLEGMNEFREQLRDQTREFLPRNEADKVTASLERAITALDGSISSRLDKINEVRERVIQAEGNMVPRAEMKLQFDTLAGRLESMTGTINQLNANLISQRSQASGKSTGLSDAIAESRAEAEAANRRQSLIIGAIALIVSLIAIGSGLYIGLRSRTVTPTTPSVTSTRAVVVGVIYEETKTKSLH
jgi:hypothetical protein